MAKSILLVEDNPDDEALALRAIGKMSTASRVVVARDGAEALDMLLGSDQPQNGHSGGLPSVILLDLKLPKVDGLEVLRRLRGSERTRLIPVVVLTNSNEDQDIMRSYNLGANSYVRKPVDYQTFTNLVSQLGQYWLTVNESPPSNGVNYAV